MKYLEPDETCMQNISTLSPVIRHTIFKPMHDFLTLLIIHISGSKFWGYIVRIDTVYLITIETQNIIFNTHQIKILSMIVFGTNK